MENAAYVFQHNTTGVQIFIYHAKDVESAKQKFQNVVMNPKDWVYLTQKIATTI